MTEEIPKPRIVKNDQPTRKELDNFFARAINAGILERASELAPTAGSSSPHADAFMIRTVDGKEHSFVLFDGPLDENPKDKELYSLFRKELGLGEL